MGMAASQARYLGLTARKTNVEYEGQQINQARTALANQSANTFNDLLALEVPTAPSTQDYTTTQYSYEDGTVGETITSMEPISNDPDGYNYLVTHYHMQMFTQALKTLNVIRRFTLTIELKIKKLRKIKSKLLLTLLQVKQLTL